MPLRVLYFAWIRERIGEPFEELDTSAETAKDLIDELVEKGDRYALAFSDLTAIKVAIDQELCELNAPLKDAKEVAFFPPMTGG